MTHYRSIDRDITLRVRAEKKFRKSSGSIEGTAIDITQRKQAKEKQTLLDAKLKKEIAERQKTEEKFWQLAETDELTGVNNRRHFWEQILMPRLQ